MLRMLQMLQMLLQTSDYNSIDPTVGDLAFSCVIFLHVSSYCDIDF